MADNPTNTIYNKNDLITYAERMALKYGIDPDIFVAQINQESGFNPAARNPSGASGIAQLMPQYYPDINWYDPYQSLEAAAQTDANNLRKFGGDYNLMLAAYDAGAGAVQQAGGVPNIPETQRYVSTIMAAAQQGNPSLQIGNDNTRFMGGQQPAGGSQPLSPDEIAQITGSAGLTQSEADTGNIGTPSYLSNVVSQMAAGDGSPDGLINSGGYTAQQWQNIIQQHGGITAATPTKTVLVAGATPVDPKQRVPDPNAPLLISFNDGTVVRANASYDPTKDIITQLENPSGPVQVNKWPGSTGGAKYSLHQQNDGSLWEINTQTGDTRQIAPAPDPTDTKTPRTITLADGRVLQYNWDTKQWNQIAAGQKNPVVQSRPDGSLWQYNQDTGQWQQVIAPDAATQAKLQADLAAAQRAIMPEQQKLVQDAYDSINAIQQQIASGQMTPQEGNALMQEVHQGLQASLAGTTLFEQQKQASTEKYQQAQEAGALIRQRITDTTNLAHNLLSTAAGHIYMSAGKTTLGIDPFAIAKNEVDQLAGGANVFSGASNVLGNYFGAGGPGAQGSTGHSVPVDNTGVVPADATQQLIANLQQQRGQSMAPTTNPSYVPRSLESPSVDQSQQGLPIAPVQPTVQLPQNNLSMLPALAQMLLANGQVTAT